MLTVISFIFRFLNVSILMLSDDRRFLQRPIERDVHVEPARI